MPERIPALQESLRRVEQTLETLTTQVSLDEATLVRVDETARKGNETALIANRTARIAKNTARMAIFGLVFDIALTIFVGWGQFTINNNQNRVNQLQSTMQMQTDRNKSAQCSEIALLLQYASRTTTNPSYTDEQRQAQVQAVGNLRQIEMDLGCPNQ